MGEPINHVLNEFKKEEELNDLELHKKITALLLAGHNQKALKLIDPSLPSPSITPQSSNPSSNKGTDTEDSTEENCNCTLSIMGFSLKCISNKNTNTKTKKLKNKPKIK